MTDFLVSAPDEPTLLAIAEQIAGLTDDEGQIRLAGIAFGAGWAWNAIPVWMRPTGKTLTTTETYETTEYQETGKLVPQTTQVWVPDPNDPESGTMQDVTTQVAEIVAVPVTATRTIETPETVRAPGTFGLLRWTPPLDAMPLPTGVVPQITPAVLDDAGEVVSPEVVTITAGPVVLTSAIPDDFQTRFA